MEFYVDSELSFVDQNPPYMWTWSEDTVYGKHLLEVIAYDRDGNYAKQGLDVVVLNFSS